MDFWMDGGKYNTEPVEHSDEIRKIQIFKTKAAFKTRKRLNLFLITIRQYPTFQAKNIIISQ